MNINIMSNSLLKHASYLLPVISAVILILFWRSTTPATVGPLGILCVFGLIYVVCVASLFAALRGLRAIKIKLKLGKSAISTKKLYYISTVAGLGPVLLLTMVGVGSLSVWSVTLIAAFIGLALFYILRAA